MQKRPTFLIAEPAPDEGLSSRKLVIETAYFNVLTAYSGPELLDAIENFPNSDALVVHSGLPSLDLPAVVKKVREKMPHAPIIALAQTSGFASSGVDVVISSHDPQELLRYVEERFGRLRKANNDFQRAS
jgi:DNA-binding response OmpR family regulator